MDLICKLRLFKICWADVLQSSEYIGSSSIRPFFLYIIGEGHEGLLEPITAVFERRRGHTLDNRQFIAGLHK